MINSLAHIFSLVAHGNLSLQGSELSNIDLSTNFTFQGISSIKFSRHQNNQDVHGLVVANSVLDWFTFLHSIKAIRLWSILFTRQQQDTSKHMTIAFSENQSPAIQVDLPNGFELWFPYWNQNQNLEFRSLLSPNSYALPAQKLSVVKKQLMETISHTEKFFKRFDVNNTDIVNCLANALESLNSLDPKVSGYPNILPDFGFSLEAHQIIASAIQALDIILINNTLEGIENPEDQIASGKIIKELIASIELGCVMASNPFTI